MKKIITILFVFTFPFLLKGNDELKLPELVSPTEDGINFTFWLKEAKAGESGDMVLSLWAKSEEKPVAIELILGTKWKPIELSTAETKQYLGSASGASERKQKGFQRQSQRRMALNKKNLHSLKLKWSQQSPEVALPQKSAVKGRGFK